MKGMIGEISLLNAIANHAKTLANHVVISGYQVGACVLADSGNVYLGANCEFKNTLPNTIHGEQCAIHNAAVHGEKYLKKIAINASPCGQCRQFMIELGNPKEFFVIFCDTDGRISEFTLEKLLPNNFGPENLDLSGRLLSSDPFPLSPPENMDNITKAAYDMAVSSYDPYTNRPSGVALGFNDVIIVGKTLENAAYNPSSSAARNAFSLASILGYDLSKITDMVMVEATCCKGDQRPISRQKETENLLSSITDTVNLRYVPVDINLSSGEQRNKSFTITPIGNLNTI
jgi:cytidine deaminase